MSDEKKRNGHLAFLGAIAALVLALLGIGGYVAAIAAEQADTKRRVDHVEKQQERDRTDFKNDQKEIKNDVKETKEQVQQIRILLERMGRERGGR